MALLAAFVLLGPPSPLAIAQSISRESVRAAVAKDAAYFETHMTSDYTYTSLKGQSQTREAAVASMRNAFATMKGAPKVSAKIVSARMEWSGLVYVEDQTVVAKVSNGPKFSTVKSNTRTQNMCVKQGATWVTKWTKVLKDSATVDGKPMPM